MFLDTILREDTREHHCSRQEFLIDSSVAPFFNIYLPLSEVFDNYHTTLAKMNLESQCKIPDGKM